jgi:hypothetical protein
MMNDECRSLVFVIHHSSISIHQFMLPWLSVVSALMFVGSLVAAPWLVTRIPADYFLRRRRLVDSFRRRHPLLRAALLAAKNLCGVVLVLAGVAMLVLPGQGILTILVGLMCIDFPGKFALEQWLVRRPGVLKAINWVRAKTHHPPLELPEPHSQNPT